jgi:hypothetical protein
LAFWKLDERRFHQHKLLGQALHNQHKYLEHLLVSRFFLFANIREVLED